MFSFEETSAWPLYSTASLPSLHRNFRIRTNSLLRYALFACFTNSLPTLSYSFPLSLSISLPLIPRCSVFFFFFPSPRTISSFPISSSRGYYSLERYVRNRIIIDIVRDESLLLFVIAPPFRGEITFAGGGGRKKRRKEKEKEKGIRSERKSGKVPRCQCSEQAEWLIDLTRERKRRKRNRRKARGEEGWEESGRERGRGDRGRWARESRAAAVWG